jgi:hypothetical protein
MAIQAPTIHKQSTFTLVDAITAFYKRLLPIATVEALYADWHPGGLEVWLVVYQASAAEREQIFAQELALMQAFPNIGLDTHLIDRAEVAPSTAVDLTTVDAFLRFPRATHHAL